jgi:uncharacterized protein (DUF433 family)
MDFDFVTDRNEVELPADTGGPPITRDWMGGARLGETRMMLDYVVWEHRKGLTAEQIVEQFDSVPPADIYALIGYYLRHRETVDAYMQRQDEVAAAVRAWVEARQGPQPTREQLLARRAARQGA